MSPPSPPPYPSYPSYPSYSPAQEELEDPLEDPREPLPLDDEGYATTYGMRQIYCVWTYSDGSRCRGTARKGTRLCYWHDPETEEERHTGLVRARQAKQPKPMVADLGPLAGEEDVDALLRQVAEYLAKDEQPDVGRAHALANVAKHLLKSFELDALRQELAHARIHLRRLKNRRKPRQKRIRTGPESCPLASSILPPPTSTGTNLSKEDSNE